MDKAHDARQSGDVASATVAAARAFVAAHPTGGPAIIDRHVSQARYQPAFTQIVEHDRHVVGVALLAHERMRLNTATLEIGTVELFIAHDADSSSIRIALLGAALGVLQQHGLPFAFMLGPAATFAPFGFVTYQLATTITNWERAPVPVRLRSLTDDDRDDIAALQAASYASLPLAALRSATDWRVWQAAQADLRGLDDAQGRLVAYASIVGDQVSEAAAADASAARQLLAALPSSTGLQLALAHSVAQAALQRGGSATVRVAISSASNPVPLAGIVDLAEALRQLVPAFQARLARSRYAGWSGTVQIETMNGRVQLTCADGRVAVGDGAQPADLRLRRVALAALPQYCLGYRAISDLRATTELDCDDAALGLLETLFPVV